MWGILSVHVWYLKIYKAIMLPVVLYGCETRFCLIEGRIQPKGFREWSAENIWT